MRGTSEKDAPTSESASQSLSEDHSLGNSLKKTIFTVLLVVIKESKPRHWVWTASTLVIDLFQLLSFALAGGLNIDFGIIQNFSAVTEKFRLYSELANSYNGFLVALYMSWAWIVIIFATLYYVFRSCQQGTIKYIFPFRFLRFSIGISLAVLFIPIAQILLFVLDCNYFSNPLHHYFLSIQCWDASHTIHSIISILFLFAFSLLLAVMTVVYFDYKPGNLMAKAHGRLDFLYLCCRLALCLNVTFFHSGGGLAIFSSIALILLSAVMTFATLYFLPYYSMLINCVKSGTYCAFLWASLCTFFALASGNQISPDALSALVFVGVPFFFIFGFVFVRFLYVKIWQNCSNGVFWNKHHVEVAARFFFAHVREMQLPQNQVVLDLLSNPTSPRPLNEVPPPQPQPAALKGGNVPPPQQQQKSQAWDEKNLLQTTFKQIFGISKVDYSSEHDSQSLSSSLDDQMMKEKCLQRQTEKIEHLKKEMAYGRKKLKNILECGTLVFPNNPFVILCHALHAEISFEDPMMSIKLFSQILNTCQDAKLDLEFLAHRCIEERRRGSGGSLAQHDVISQFELARDMKTLKRSHLRALKALAAFWESLADAHVSLQAIEGALENLNRWEAEADQVFKSVLKRTPGNPRVLRSYASFLMEVKHDTTRATQMLQEADDVEESSGKVLNAQTTTTTASTVKHPPTLSQRPPTEPGFGSVSKPSGGQHQQSDPLSSAFLPLGNALLDSLPPLPPIPTTAHHPTKQKGREGGQYYLSEEVYQSGDGPSFSDMRQSDQPHTTFHQHQTSGDSKHKTKKKRKKTETANSSGPAPQAAQAVFLNRSHLDQHNSQSPPNGPPETIEYPEGWGGGGGYQQYEGGGFANQANRQRQQQVVSFRGDGAEEIVVDMGVGMEGYAQQQQPQQGYAPNSEAGYSNQMSEYGVEEGQGDALEGFAEQVQNQGEKLETQSSGDASSSTATSHRGLIGSIAKLQKLLDHGKISNTNLKRLRLTMRVIFLVIFVMNVATVSTIISDFSTLSEYFSVWLFEASWRNGLLTLIWYFAKTVTLVYGLQRGTVLGNLPSFALAFLNQALNDAKTEVTTLSQEFEALHLKSWNFVKTTAGPHRNLFLDNTLTAVVSNMPLSSTAQISLYNDWTYKQLPTVTYTTNLLNLGNDFVKKAMGAVELSETSPADYNNFFIRQNVDTLFTAFTRSEEYFQQEAMNRISRIIGMQSGFLATAFIIFVSMAIFLFLYIFPHLDREKVKILNLIVATPRSICSLMAQRVQHAIETEEDSGEDNAGVITETRDPPVPLSEIDFSQYFPTTTKRELTLTRSRAQIHLMLKISAQLVMLFACFIAYFSVGLQAASKSSVAATDLNWPIRSEIIRSNSFVQELATCDRAEWCTWAAQSLRGSKDRIETLIVDFVHGDHGYTGVLGRFDDIDKLLTECDATTSTCVLDPTRKVPLGGYLHIAELYSQYILLILAENSTAVSLLHPAMGTLHSLYNSLLVQTVQIFKSLIDHMTATFNDYILAFSVTLASAILFLIWMYWIVQKRVVNKIGKEMCRIDLCLLLLPVEVIELMPDLKNYILQRAKILESER